MRFDILDLSNALKAYREIGMHEVEGEGERDKERERERERERGRDGEREQESDMTEVALLNGVIVWKPPMFGFCPLFTPMFRNSRLHPNVWVLSSFHPNVSKQPPPPQCLGFVLFSP